MEEVGEYIDVQMGFNWTLSEERTRNAVENMRMDHEKLGKKM